MNAAETSASRAMADCTPLTVVSRSCTTEAIDTFISDVSTTSTNIAIARRIARRVSPDAGSASPGPGRSLIRPASCRVRSSWCRRRRPATVATVRPVRVDRAEGGPDARIEVVAVERLEQPVPLHEVLEPAAHLDEGEMDAAGVQLIVELLEDLGRRDVDVGDRLALEDDPRWRALARQRPDLPPERAGVGEEERRLPPVDHDA